jgi:hypothetical protein
VLHHPNRGSARVAVTVCTIAAFALFASGCGGSSETTKANRQWANDVCTSIGAWKKQVHQAYTSLSPSFSVQERLHQAIGATQVLVTELKAIGLPDTNQDQKAQQSLKKMATDLQTQLDQSESAAKELKAGDTQGATKLLSQLAAATGSVVSGLVALRKVVSGDLAVALGTTRACRNLGG